MRCDCGSIRRAWRERGLTATDVISALNEQNVQVAAGEVGQPPSRDGQSYQISVRAIGRLTEAVGIRQHRFEDRGRTERWCG